MLRDHRLSITVVLAAFACVGGVFLFARPEYRPLRGEEFRGDTFKAPADASGAAGWKWADGTPGYRFGHDEKHWNFSELRPVELAGARAAASQFGVAPESVRPLLAQRLSPQDPSMIVAGRGAAGRTCLGFVLPKAKVSFTCPGDQVGFVVASAQPSFGTRTGRGFPLFLMGVSRGDVSRIVVTAPSVSQTVHRDGHVTREPLSRQEVYKRGDGWWGTFSLTLSNSYLRAVPGRPWRMRIDFYGDHGLLASRFLAFARPGDRVVAAVSRS